jgi:hypothetical protein
VRVERTLAEEDILPAREGYRANGAREMIGLTVGVYPHTGQVGPQSVF